MQVRIYVTPKGVQRVFLISAKRKPTVESLAFYAKLEPAIEQFRVGVRQALLQTSGGIVTICLRTKARKGEEEENVELSS